MLKLLNFHSLAVNLIDILQAIAPALLTTQWQISHLECLGTTAEKLHQIADTQQWISGELLLQLTTEITQVIDGKFQGNRLNENQPWLIITAVDSSAYDIESLDENILDRIRQQFQQVSELPILYPLILLSFVTKTRQLRKNCLPNPNKHIEGTHLRRKLNPISP